MTSLFIYAIALMIAFPTAAAVFNFGILVVSSPFMDWLKKTNRTSSLDVVMAIEDSIATFLAALTIRAGLSYFQMSMNWIFMALTVFVFVLNDLRRIRSAPQEEKTFEMYGLTGDIFGLTIAWLVL